MNTIWLDRRPPVGEDYYMISAKGRLGRVILYFIHMFLDWFSESWLVRKELSRNDIKTSTSAGFTLTYYQDIRMGIDTTGKNF